MIFDRNRRLSRKRYAYARDLFALANVVVCRCCFEQKGISFSIVSPRKIPMLYKLYEMVCLYSFCI